ncbi:hypothetical protein MRS76_19220 [Rhizobiaceae bacterium n13]|uniref:hypothetical protein n=1 Tax=Ferirhizobium litorale TaxID=2927786 RepID=UPI0024B311C7|nr:hypothetical protein [Fererhizobium litorale]MDI7864083.1 hypothetical protein [Fererhizobium litorale]
MQLDDILHNVADQDRGRELEIVDPWTGKPAGIRFRIAGPDSTVQHRARIQMMDELAEAADQDGKVTAETRERARVNCLAKCVLLMEIEEEGKPVAMSHKNVLRVLMAAAWIQAQVDAFAGDRRNFAPEGH